MAAFLELLGEIAADALGVFAARNRTWTGILVVGFVAIVVAAIVWITAG
jgi:hypothetical protein